MKAISKAMIDAACDDAVRVTGAQVTKWAEHTMICLLVKSNKRYESWYKMTKMQFFRALKDGKKVFFPYKPVSSEQELQDGGGNIVLSENCAYRLDTY